MKNKEKVWREELNRYFTKELRKKHLIRETGLSLTSGLVAGMVVLILGQVLETYSVINSLIGGILFLIVGTVCCILFLVAGLFLLDKLNTREWEKVENLREEIFK